MLNKPKQQGIQIMFKIIESYHKIYPLQHIKIDILFACICLHALIRVMARAKDIAFHPENKQRWDYYTRPCWKLLHEYKHINQHKMSKLIRNRIQYKQSNL